MKPLPALLLAGAVIALTDHASAQVIYRNVAPPVVPVVPAAAPPPAPVPAPVASSAVALAASPATPGFSAIYPAGSAVTRPTDRGASIPPNRFGSNVPFSLAVMSILPSGYTAHYQGVDQNALVNWSGGRPWRDVLDSLAAAHGYETAYAGNGVVILGGAAEIASPMATSPVQSAPAASAAPSAVAAGIPVAALPGHARQQDSVTIAEVTPQTHSAASIAGGPARSQYSAATDGDGLVPTDSLGAQADAPKMTYAPRGGGYGVYYAAADQDLAQVLRVWAAANGWKVRDDTNVSYPLDVSVPLKGDFKSVSRMLIHSIRAIPAPQPFFYNGDQTLRLYNFENEREGTATGQGLALHTLPRHGL